MTWVSDLVWCLKDMFRLMMMIPSGEGNVTDLTLREGRDRTADCKGDAEVELVCSSSLPKHPNTKLHMLTRDIGNLDATRQLHLWYSVLMLGTLLTILTGSLIPPLQRSKTRKS